MSDLFGLVGEPLPASRSRRGRPRHATTQANINTVKALVKAECLHEEIARHLGITLPTLRRHYFHVMHIRRRKKNG
jgi:hypothetical protein